MQKISLSRTFSENPVACCGDEAGNKSFQRGLIFRRKVRDLLRVILLISVVIFFFVAYGYGLEFDNSVKPIEINAGQDFTIKLQSNATTGYQWKIDGNIDEKVVKFLRSDYKALPVKMIGSGGWEFWTFKATGKGITKINMIYVRPWEKPGFKEKTKSFTVIVR